MVKIRENHPETSDDVEIGSWVKSILKRAGATDLEAEGSLLKRACEFAKRYENTPGDANTNWGGSVTSYLAGLEMAELLADLHLDVDALVASIVYRTVREGKATEAQVRDTFGDTVAELINGVRHMAAITQLSNNEQSEVFGKGSEAQAENLRKTGGFNSTPIRTRGVKVPISI